MDEEIKKFDAICDWWDTHGSMRLLHRINPIRLNYIDSFVSHFDEKNVLDLGCGGGILTESLAQRALYTKGIDLSHESLSAARAHAAQEARVIDYEHIDATCLSEREPQTWDVITCMELLEHVPHPEEIVSAVSKLLKPQGLVFFSTIHRNLKSYLFTILCAEYILKWLPRGTHDYKKFIKPSELCAWAQTNQLAVLNVSGITYHPFFNYFSLSRDVSMNYITCFQKIL